jgi:NADP-dependent 3-hydroxy acid dehydrogenase YdfG
MPDQAGRTIVVTGPSLGGLGHHTALELARRGARVVLAGRTPRKLDETSVAIADEVPAADVVPLVVDLSDLASVRSAGAAAAALGPIDVLVNNAGVMPLSPLAALRVDEWDRMIDVNIRGVLHGIAAVLPTMQAQGGGQVVNVASIGAHAVSPTAAVYCATKYAVWALSEGLRQEHSDIRVTTISPGVTESELAETISDAQGREEMKAFRAVAIAADAIARAIRFAIEQPADVDTSEIIMRPTASPH